MVEARPIAVGISGLSKRYPGVTALDAVTLEFARGRVTAVVGENGAGKSTLMSILSGLQRPDGGTVIVDGRPVRSFSPHAFLHELGIALVPQEIALCPDRSVADNVLLGREPGSLPSRRAMISTTRKLLERIDTEIDPQRKAGRLTVAEQQLVLIVRAIARDCRVLILDEPTTSLTANEVSRLFLLLRRLRDEGTTIIYVSHRLPEVFELSDHIHVLRDGRLAASFDTPSATAEQLVESMVGRALAQRHEADRPIGEAVLDVVGLSGPGFTDVSFQVCAGEIVGVAGLPGSGRSEVVTALFGASRTSDGTVAIDHRPVRLRSPRTAIRAGVGYVPAERRSQGVFPDMTVGGNATILDLDRIGRFGCVRRRTLRRLAAQRLSEFDVRGSVNGSIAGLSGGNQQKVILSRWLARAPRVLLLDDPTRGVDVGAKAEIYDRLDEAAESGTALLVSSSDLPELLRICERIIVMCEGRLAGIVNARTTTESAIIRLATGSHRVGDDREVSNDPA